MSARVGTFFFFAVMLGVGSSVQAQQGSGAVFTISGTSTVRGWSCPATGTVKITPGKTAPAVPGFPNGIQSITVTVPVKAIACEDSIMVDHVLEAFKEKTFPVIVYTITGYTLQAPAPGPGGSKSAGDRINATGNLKIFAVTKPLNLDMQLTSGPQGARVSGEVSMDMTQWTVVPPVIFAGLLKVAKDVRIKFEAPLQP